MNEMQKKLSNKLPGLKKDEALAPYTTFKIGGPAKFFYVAKNNNEVVKAITVARELSINFFVLGNGSNILISDHGFDGLVIKMENNKTHFNGNQVIAESGVKLQKMVRESITHSLTGLECLIGIPGTVGGGVAGNVGTVSEWIDSKLIQVEILDAQNRIIQIPKSQGDFSYRTSRFKYNDKEIILSAEFSLEKSTQSVIQKKVKNYLDIRSTQPVDKPNAGSIFKNPSDKKVWEIIDSLGLRGKKIGAAQISPKHANFIINTGSAKAEDVVILISMIKQQARDTLGIQLHEEIKYVGF